nr:MAG TPA: hypothetical protein [Caudoviricetes sp.]
MKNIWGYGLKSVLRYGFERIYPYMAGVIIVLVCIKGKVNIRINENYNQVLEGVVTLSSIIIGFLGAILPMVLSTKQESKFVRYIFENDKDGLFSKYLKATISLGLLDALISLLMYVNSSFPAKCGDIMYCGWIFISISFIVATYRSMSHMITFIFARDEDEEDEKEKSSVCEDEKEEIRKKYQ